MANCRYIYANLSKSVEIAKFYAVKWTVFFILQEMIYKKPHDDNEFVTITGLF
jgi:hypothetical protein